MAKTRNQIALEAVNRVVLSASDNKMYEASGKEKKVGHHIVMAITAATEAVAATESFISMDHSDQTMYNESNWKNSAKNLRSVARDLERILDKLT